MAAAEASAALPPRLIWRRLLAFAIDAGLCWAIVAILFGLFVKDTVGEGLVDEHTTLTIGFKLDTGTFLPPIQFGTKTCGMASGVPSDVAAAVSPAEVSSVRYCFERFLGLPFGATAEVQVKETPAVADWPAKTITLDLVIVTFHRFANLSALGLFIALSTLSLRFVGTTPGKKLMGLRVTGAMPMPAFRREMMRSLPYILSVAVVRLLIEFANDRPEIATQANLVVATVQVLAIGAAIYLWLWPLLRWRGALVHDRRLGLRVIDDRTGQGTAPAPETAP